MIVLVLFAFLAGVITILSPCILPILPIILSSTIGGKSTGRARPIGVVVGFIASFTFFTLFLSTVVRLSGISADVLRFLSFIIIASFGVSLLIPQFQVFLEQLFSRLSRYLPQTQKRAGFTGGIIVGLSLGLLWTPCVGPILASVISLAIIGTVTLDAFFITLAYSLGTALPMFVIMLAGQNVLQRVPWLLRNTSKIQKVFGFVMIITAVGILMNADRTFQTFIINKFPQYGAGLISLEDNEHVRKQLENIDSRDSNKANLGRPMFDVSRPKGILAPEIVSTGAWFNSKPLKLSELKGKVVVIDFWTYSCINCQRTLPYLKKWWEKYKDKGLVIIGVHSPEFEFEKNEANVAKAIADFQLTYPVVQDNDFLTWRSYNNRYWPAKYIVDAEGYIRYTHFGEGEYDETERVIQQLLEESGAKDLSDEVNNPTYEVYSRTPETYLGYERIEGFASPEQITPDASASYTVPNTIFDNNFAYNGQWTIHEQYAQPEKGAQLHFNFESKEVYLVMRGSGKVKVYVDGQVQYPGKDVKDGTVTIDADRLYTLVSLPTPGRHILRLEFEDSTTEVYAFTFG